jgi:hypothetical protein
LLPPPESETTFPLPYDPYSANGDDGDDSDEDEAAASGAAEGAVVSPLEGMEASAGVAGGGDDESTGGDADDVIEMGTVLDFARVSRGFVEV